MNTVLLAIITICAITIAFNCAQAKMHLAKVERIAQDIKNMLILWKDE